MSAVRVASCGLAAGVVGTLAMDVLWFIRHWGYGLQWGALFGLSIGCSRRVRLWHGPVLGALVWLASYAVLPIAGFYKPIWKYDLKTLWADLSAHLVYGVGVAATFWKLCSD